MPSRLAFRGTMALHADCRVSGDASMLALTKGTLADFAIPHGEPDPEEQVFANAAWDPAVISYLVLVVMLPIKGSEIHFSHVRPPRAGKP